MSRKILVLEDEENIRSFVVINLVRAGYTVIEAQTGEQCLELLKKHQDIKLFLLDVMLTGELTGIDICREIRATDTLAGIIILSAKSQEVDKVTGLMTGADDYITKPFSPTELIARVDSLYRRISQDSTDTIESGPFSLSIKNRTLRKNGNLIRLSQTEFALMVLFMQNQNKAFSRTDILRSIWGEKQDIDTKIVNVNIRRLRMKIENDPSNPKYITTSWNYGYKWGDDL